MGWGNPYVIAGISCGVGLLVAFPFVERKVKYPMFKLSLFKVRTFSAGVFAGFLSSIARGGVMIMLSILLQGIWLPLHGVSYVDTPFWAGIYLLPLSAGFVTMGPISGTLSDKYGARGLATLGMLITMGTFLGLVTLPYNFNYYEFAVLVFVQGIGMGMFASPNTASIMNSVPAEHRGAASGMRSTMQNTGQVVSMTVFFAVIIVSLSNSLPAAFSSALSQAGVSSQLLQYFTSLSPTQVLFSAFLGYNPIGSIISAMPANLQALLTPQTIATLTSLTWFPMAIATSFMSALADVFYVSAGLCLVAALASLMRGKKYLFEDEKSGEQ
jgi:MFS family permease